MVISQHGTELVHRGGKPTHFPMSHY